MWDDVWPALARRYRVARFDMRGYGDSAVAAAPYAPHDDVVAVLDHLGFEPAVLCGVSFGGASSSTLLWLPWSVCMRSCSSAAALGDATALRELRALIDEADEAGERGDIDVAVELSCASGWTAWAAARRPIRPFASESAR